MVDAHLPVDWHPHRHDGEQHRFDRAAVHHGLLLHLIDFSGLVNHTLHPYLFCSHPGIWQLKSGDWFQTPFYQWNVAYYY